MQVAAGSQGSQAVMERGDQQSAKKPRLAAEPLLHAPVKQEIVVHQPAGDATEDLQDAAELTADGMAVDARRPVRHPNQRGDVACPRSGGIRPRACPPEVTSHRVRLPQLSSTSVPIQPATAVNPRPARIGSSPVNKRGRPRWEQRLQLDSFASLPDP